MGPSIDPCGTMWVTVSGVESEKYFYMRCVHPLPQSCLYCALRMVPRLIPKYFCAVFDYVGKADLSKGYWNPKRKLGVTIHIFRDN